MAKEKCDRNCATCGTDNRSFCAVQMAMANQELLLSLLKEVKDMKNGDKDFILPSLASDKSEPTDSGTVTING